MSRIDAIFQDMRSRGAKGLMPFIVAGRPSLGRLDETLVALEDAGACIVEIGFPFSDPIADGPVIAAAMHEALESGVTTRGVLEAVGAARASTGLGLVAMVSVSIVYRMGIERFVEEAKAAGFDGFIFPDATIDEAPPLIDPVRRAGLSASLLVSPTTPPQRAARIAAACTGFVYMLARVGITGEREEAPDIAAHVEAVRSATTLPLACGFGISRSEHVQSVLEHVDAAIVGSALVRRIETAIEADEDPVAAARTFIRDLARGLPAPSRATDAGMEPAS